ncbi:MAG TPA: LAGLIDADG family homing endonuclease [archaeon]|nr:LAGLIDADG family homing endonuclease [archaeon]
MVMATTKEEMAEGRKQELVTKFRMLLEKKYQKALAKAAERNRALEMDFSVLDKFNPEMGDMLLQEPDKILEIAEEAVNQIYADLKMKVRFLNLPGLTNIRDLRSKHLNKFVMVEGTVRRASEIRPEIMATFWQCEDCGDIIRQPRRGAFISRPWQCSCGKRDFKQIESEKIDTRWLTIEEPFELTEGDRPSQVNIFMSEDLVSSEGRRMSDPGNRLRITGILREVPKGKPYSVKLDFYLDANQVQPTESDWVKMEITKEDEQEIRKLASQDNIYELFVDSLAPSLYGLREVKESIIMQLFGGVPRTLKDGVHFRGDMHILLIGDPASGKSQLLKLVPEIVPRGKYVSGKGATGAGLCMSYDTLVQSAHGEIRKIGDIVEEALKKGSEKISQGFVGDKGDFETVSLDTRTLKMKKMRASKFFKLKPTGSLVKLRTRTGREIKLTQENPVMVISNGEVAWKQANEIEPGEHIALARYLPINHLSTEMQPEFARFLGMVAGDGDIGEREIRFHNGSENYLDSFSGICKSLGYKTRKYYQKDRVACVRLASKDLCDKVESLGMPRGRKAGKIAIPKEILLSNQLVSEFLSGIFDCDGCVVSKGNGSYIEYTTISKTLAQHIQTSLLRFGIISKIRERQPSRKGFVGKHLKYEIIIRGRENLGVFREHIGFTFEKGKKLDSVLSRESKSNTNIDVIPGIGERLNSVRKSLKIPIKNRNGLYFLKEYEHGRRDFSRQSLLKFISLLGEKQNHEYFEYLKKLSQSDIFWDEIVSKTEVQEEWVYDLTVEGEHNFVANDFIVHNTATVTKDEQFMGGWVLEAGALVLANKGLLSIDEFEKMSIEDQVAMHEGLEQGTVSIAKASIIATLPAKTSVLAGGNPKFSRFDPYMAIAKQITIPDTLLSRFDLKFALRDVPDSETDKLLVDHILKSRHDDYEATIPKLSSKFIRKYIAYAKEHCKPELTEESEKILKNFYIKTRKKAEGTTQAIPITLRQFEALMRISEASAKMQLSPIVRKEDAQRAIKLMRFSLRQLGFDPETGQIDVDRAEGATSSSERGKIRIVMDIINDISSVKKEIHMEEIRQAAKKEGIEDVDEIIEKLKREGMLFEPSPGYVQKV